MQLREVKRHIEDTKPCQVIADIEFNKSISKGEDRKELEKIESDLRKVIDQFDKVKKKIKILNPLLLEKNNILNNNEKNEKSTAHKKKIIPEKITTNTNNNQDIFPNYELPKFQRPDNYIIYNPSNKKNSKEYEATYADFCFLKYLNYDKQILKIEKLEEIMSALENAIGKNEKIPDEIAKKIIEEKLKDYDNKENLINQIITHFNDRRKEAKKSLLRKFWRIQKSTDKFLPMTFRRNNREKMKFRKNNQKKEESYNKVKEAGDLCKNDLLLIINSLLNKESLNQYIYEIENLIFNTEVNRIKKTSINKEIKINSEIKNNIQKLISSLKEKEIDLKKDLFHQNDNSSNDSPTTETSKKPNQIDNSISIDEDLEMPTLNENINNGNNNKQNHKRSRRINEIFPENYGNKKQENLQVNLDLLNFKNRLFNGKENNNNYCGRKRIFQSIRYKQMYVCNNNSNYDPFNYQKDKDEVLYEKNKINLIKNNREIDYFFKEFCNLNFDVDFLKNDDDEISLKSKILNIQSKKRIVSENLK